MKDRRQANKGKPFEDLIRFANMRYQQKGLAVISKQATEFIPLRDRTGKLVSAKVESKATVDFLGRYKHYPIAIEAKHSDEDSISFNRVEPHQADYMDDFTREAGTIGLVILSFNLKRFFVIPWEFWQAAYDLRVRLNDKKTPRSVSAYGTTWNIPLKKSVRVDELDPSWEIPRHDFDFGLNYLLKAGQYVKAPGGASTRR